VFVCGEDSLGLTYQLVRRYTGHRIVHTQEVRVVLRREFVIDESDAVRERLDAGAEPLKQPLLECEEPREVVHCRPA
jgi:hypothetical protein